MKKFIIAISVLLIISVFCACGNGDIQPSQSPESTPTIQPSETPDPDSPAVATVENPPEGTLKNYHIKYDKYELYTDQDNAQAVKLYFTFTNNSQEAKTFSDAIQVLAFQDGAELVVAPEQCQQANQKVKAGESIQVFCNYKLLNTSSEIELEITEVYNDDSDATVTAKIQLK